MQVWAQWEDFDNCKTAARFIQEHNFPGLPTCRVWTTLKEVFGKQTSCHSKNIPSIETVLDMARDIKIALWKLLETAHVRVLGRLLLHRTPQGMLAHAVCIVHHPAAHQQQEGTPAETGANTTLPNGALPGVRRCGGCGDGFGG